jgi:hypothetical protein
MRYMFRPHRAIFRQHTFQGIHCTLHFVNSILNVRRSYFYVLGCLFFLSPYCGRFVQGTQIYRTNGSGTHNGAQSGRFVQGTQICRTNGSGTHNGAQSGRLINLPPRHEDVCGGGDIDLSFLTSALEEI